VTSLLFMPHVGTVIDQLHVCVYIYSDAVAWASSKQCMSVLYS